MNRALQSTPWAPWMGLLFPPLLWAVYRQFSGELVGLDCRAASTSLIASVGVGVALICALSAFVSFASRPVRYAAGEVRTLVAFLATISGGALALAVISQTIAVLSLPSC